MEEFDPIRIQRHTISVFRKNIVEKVKPSQILPYLAASLPSLQATDIKARERTSPREAAELLVDQLLNCSEPGWFQAFIDALKATEHDALVKLLEGEEPTKVAKADNLYRALLRVFEPALHKIKPSELIPYLVSEQCLSVVDEQEICHKEQNEGEFVAAGLLLERIHSKNENYFMHFMEALKQSGYQSCVDEIEPAFNKTCSVEGAMNVVEQMPRVYEKGDTDLSTSAPNVAVVFPQVACAGVGEAASSQVDVQEDLDVQEHQMEYSSMETDGDIAVMAGNIPIVMEAAPGETETERKDVIEENNSMHFQDDPETSTTSLDYHPNIPMENNLNMPANGRTDDAESVADNTMMPGGEVGRGEPLKLRDYQMELAQESVKGKNNIVVAPTGSGKTHVAVYITKLHLEAADVEEDPKVLFLAPTVSLVNQQKEMFRKYLPAKFRTTGVCGDGATSQLSLGQLLPNKDVFVLTPQILVDALNEDEAEIAISNFSLLIFDECHHTDKGHPYNKVMALYMDKKLEGQHNLPQVVGLTASVGVGKAKGVKGAVDHILKLCANLDAGKLCTVQEHRRELLSHTNRAHEEAPKEVPGRNVDPFKDEICQLMQTIETKLIADVQQKDQQMGNLSKDLVAPPGRGSERYTQWVNSLKRPIAKIRDSNMKQLVFACVRHLKMYNEALLINADCQTLDAVNYIHNDLEQIKQTYPNETELWLERIFNEREDALKKISKDVRYSNPKLESLREDIMKVYEEDKNSCGIIFCKTRAITLALERWMRETNDLESLNPKRLVAANAPTEKGGMEQSEQNDVLRLFRDGHHKIIIATSVAEEGLDIQACNFVIRYDHVTNETARIQARGRARRTGAKYALLTEEGSRTAERDELNRIREDMMEDAIRRIDSMDLDDFQQRVKSYQEEAKRNRVMELLGKQAQMRMKRARPVDDDYTLSCSKCHAFACFSSDIHRIEKSHHVVISEDFKELAHVKKHHRPCNYDGMNKMGKLHCGKCDKDWGVVVRYKKVFFPVLKLSDFVVEDANGRPDCYNKWKDVPFVVSELTAEEMRRLAVEGRELVTVENWIQMA